MITLAAWHNGFCYETVQVATEAEIPAMKAALLSVYTFATVYRKI